MTVEVIVQSGHEQGVLDGCVSFLGLPLHSSVRIAIVSEADALRHAPFDCVCRELSVFSHRGGCNGRPAGGSVAGSRAHGVVGVRHVAVLLCLWGHRAFGGPRVERVA